MAKRPPRLLRCDDRATPPDLQRAKAKRANAVVELPTGHHPFLSQPALLADDPRPHGDLP